ncbi:hypothetical protein QFC20_006098 [Naganishia adeliensis]|uniref:Uncharacterized protein n=1 Tax=Naganishia adeliensis TaxID=92952 RepID=A0ACC2VG27_9TREE|nr:hypothetical protein QFC20_006098 [Naganishia adeliensis]
MSTRLQRPRPSSSRQSSGSSLPYLNDLNDVSGSDNDAEQGLERTKSRVTLKGKGMFSRADVDKCGRINVMLNLKHKGPLDLPKDYALSVAEQGLEPNGRSCAGSYKYDQDSTIDPFGPDCPELNIVIGYGSQPMATSGNSSWRQAEEYYDGDGQRWSGVDTKK